MKTASMTIHIVNESRPRAKKPHTCLICGEAIPCGEAHWRLVYRNDTDRERRKPLHTIRTHVHCPPPGVSRE